MFAKFLTILSVMGLLAACSAPAPVVSADPSPSAQVENSPAPEATTSPEPALTPIGFVCGNVLEIPLEECQALVTLYENTDGDSWLDNSGWLVNPTPCSWYGVVCQQGHVVELQLYYNELTGSLPGEIGNLTELKSLYLDRSQLSGPIPPEIGNLTKLEVARLGGNQFDSLPLELTDLKNLVFLELWGNRLSGEIPDELGSLPRLQVLNLSANEFTGSIPPQLGKLTNLHNLDLSNNQLEGPIPAELGDLAVLNELNLSFNQLSGPIPAEFENFLYLYLLDLSYNQLTGEVPSALAKAPIADLKLWGNQLDGTIPASNEEMTTVDYEGVHFEISSDLIESIWREVVAAQPPLPEAPGWNVRPEHIRFTMAGPREQSSSQRTRAGMAAQPQILVYPAKEYSEMSEFAKAEVDALQSMLVTRPAISEDKLPFLPLINAAQVFHAQEKYLDFQNGSGVRYITQYAQDMGPITNQNIFYTFQGLTQDGESYVAAYFPISASGLSDEPVVEDWNTFASGYQDYLKENKDRLNALSSDEFEPSLEVFDQIIQSLMADTP